MDIIVSLHIWKVYHINSMFQFMVDGVLGESGQLPVKLITPATSATGSGTEPAIGQRPLSMEILACPFRDSLTPNHV